MAHVIVSYLFVFEKGLSSPLGGKFHVTVMSTLFSLYTLEPDS